VFIVASTARLGYAQNHDTRLLDREDASDIARGPSTWKGAITGSLRLLMIEHVSR